MNADVWINGVHLGNHPYGYTSFWYDITDKIKFGDQNFIAVQVKNVGLNSRWYTGSGIYRHVWLSVLEPVHVAQWGTYITSTNVSRTNATVNVKSTVENQSGTSQRVRVTVVIRNPKGEEVGRTEKVQSLSKNEQFDFDYQFNVVNPGLWSVDTPMLYKAITQVFIGDKLSDETVSSFGIRSISFDVANGFSLNGQPLKLQGGCVHHDNGPLGAKAYDRAEERRVELLKASGFNAIRCAHNPPSPAFLDACDRLGMLVMDEAFDMWRLPNNPEDYHLYFDQWWQRDIESMVMRDRNHPSIIIWSIGNEIKGMENPEVIAVGKMLANHIRQLEPTRPIAAAVNNLRPQKDSFFSILDVCGYNYAAGGDHHKKNIYALDHERVPARIMFGTESYPLEAFSAWKAVLDYSYVMGDFVWTAFDYIGEASIGWRGYLQQPDFYPWNLAYCGDIDICGWKRPQSYYRDALWKKNQISIFVKPRTPSFPINPKKKRWSKWEWNDVKADWTWTGQERKRFEVNVYSSCDEVELFVKGKSLGKKITNTNNNKLTAIWKVKYDASELRAVGYNNGRSVADAHLETASAIAQIKLSPDRANIHADGQDLSYITVELLDEKGIRNPKAENLVKFDITGPGSIVAVGNANPISLESYQLPMRKAWQGRCLVIVKSSVKPGTITLNASVAGIPGQSVTITTNSY